MPKEEVDEVYVEVYEVRFVVGQLRGGTLLDISEGKTLPDGETKFFEYHGIVSAMKDKLNDGGRCLVTTDEILNENLAIQWFSQWTDLKLKWYMDKNWRLMSQAIDDWAAHMDVG